jgi:hypothetical protein
VTGLEPGHVTGSALTFRTGCSPIVAGPSRPWSPWSRLPTCWECPPGEWSGWLSSWRPVVVAVAVSEMAAHLGAQVTVFRERPLDAGPYSFVWADTLTVKVREDSREVNVHALIAIGVDAPFGQKLFHVAVGQSVPQIPAHCDHDRIRREPESGEAGPRRWRLRVATTHQHSLAEPVIGLRNSASRRGRGTAPLGAVSV